MKNLKSYTEAKTLFFKTTLLKFRLNLKFLLISSFSFTFLLHLSWIQKVQN